MKNIKGLIFDYGGTIDTDSLHWSEVLWKVYQQTCIPVSKEEFRTSYVFAERALARHPYIKPEHNFLDLLLIKCELETKDLVDRGVWTVSEEERKHSSDLVARYCYQYVLDTLKVARPVLERLSRQYPMVLVSNFYGNIHTILRDFNLEFFQEVVESAVVGIRKPDPAIFQLGVDALGMKAEETVVIGDSFSKDIVPASKIGCNTVWIKGIGWGNEEIDESVPTLIIHSISELEANL